MTTMLRLTGEQFTTFAKAQDLRFELVVGGSWLTGSQAVFQNNRLQVSQAVFDCMVDPDTIDATMRSLDIVVLKTVDLSELVPMPIPEVDIDQIYFLFGIRYGWSVPYTPPDITKGLHGEDITPPFP